MSSAVIQLLVLAGIAVFLIVRLKNVLGTRDGFEKPPVGKTDKPESRISRRHDFEVIEGGPDRDITDHVEDGTESAKALAAMKMAEPGFSVSEFLQGARGAYEMILTAFEKGDISEVRGFLSEEVAEAFDGVIDSRAEQGLTVEADIVGVRDVQLSRAAMDRDSKLGEITVTFLAEMTSVVRNAEGEIVEGDPRGIKRQRDVWTFARTMGANDPNWQLVATGE
ncbi:Tim44/TimA family putative adaptor protein [Profundibacterium mesophilum]|uniref:Tim44-like domain containing protein n=1 Tax=Profundibacterium mesophilum KAUST100406-0324 TaxID=1037889 RepID=A0A921NRE2_9RHOB|nr:Tim44/TimA family putative adaptor protein [Profundibacterium mesophilum]KAF0676310.1 Tim44-like domain containing protein [Profundibacterium mesophilum KAUST100406-0324]